MTYLTHIQPLEGPGVTDADIAAIVSKPTVHPIITGEIIAWLIDSEIAVQSTMTPSKWTGPLNEILVNTQAPLDLRKGLDFFFGFMNDSKTESMKTNRPTHGAMMCQLLDALVQLGVITADQRLSFLELGGGIVKANCTSQDVAACRASYQASIPLTIRLDTIDSALQVKVSGLRQQIRDGVDVTETLGALEAAANA